MKREEILSLCASNPEAIVAYIEGLESYIEGLESQIRELTERMVALESRLNQNSRNSSRPHSTDYFVKEKPNPKSLRKKSGKQPGGQEGHSGTTLEMVDDPE